MPRYESPYSHLTRLLFLNRSSATGATDIAAGRNYITAGTLAAVNAQLAPYRTALAGLPALSSDRSKEIRESNVAVAVVQVYVRDMWDLLKRRAARLGQPAEVLQF